MSGRLAVIVPAIKKNVAFPDDLVKKLAGKTLVSRAIDKALSMTGPEAVFLITDSEEIRLIGERAGIMVHWDKSLNWNSPAMRPSFLRYMQKDPGSFDFCVLLSPYAPLLSASCIEDAFKVLLASGKQVLLPVQDEQRAVLHHDSRFLLDHLMGLRSETSLIQFRGFCIFSGRVLDNLLDTPPLDAELFPVSPDQIEIDSYQSWWICEKLLQRKRILFRVIGNEQVGMGHIYRALALAHEISDHEIMFVCDDESILAATQLAGYDYWLASYPKESILGEICTLKPDLVVNDMLNTVAEDIALLRKEGIRVVNFEDLGSGAKLADLTINELYDEPQFKGGNVLWGHEYFFVRDEFYDARTQRFRSKVDNLLLGFGGTDHQDLTRKIFHAIRDYCRRRRIKIHIVTGPGYQHFEALSQEVEEDSGTTLTRGTGVISELMERCQIAITSNGRTVYELAHMNIPAIVIAQHAREKTHAFACPENGFLPLGTYRQDITENMVGEHLQRLVEDVEFRRQLFASTSRFRFNRNKGKVVRRILSLLGDADA